MAIAPYSCKSGIIVTHKFRLVPDFIFFLQCVLKSEEEKGSDFIFTAQFEKQMKLHNNINSNIMNKLGQKKILIVDDNITNRMVLTTYLRFWGCELYECKSASRAIKLLKESVWKDKTFDLVIMDHLIPGIKVAE